MIFTFFSTISALFQISFVSRDWIIQCAIVVVDQCCRSKHRLQLFCNLHFTWMDKDMRWTYLRYRPNTGQAFSCIPLTTTANEYISVTESSDQMWSVPDCVQSDSLFAWFCTHWQPASKVRKNSYIFWSRQQPDETYEWYTELDRVLQTKN